MRKLSDRLPTTRPGLGVLVAVTLAAGTALAAPLAASADPVPMAVPAKHFVDCSKTVNGDGTEQSPWNSVGAVNRHGGFIPGDRILLKRATTCTGRLSPTGSGARGKPIVLGAYGHGVRPTVAGGGTANNSGAVQVINQQYWTIQDLHITNKTKSANPKTYRSGLLLLNSGVGYLSGITVQRVAIDSVRSNPGNGNTRMYGGISALTFGTMKSGFRGLRIVDNTVRDVSRTGIITSNVQYPKANDSDTRISGNRLRSIRGDGIVMIGAKHGRIDHNTVTGAADLGSCGHCGRMGGPSTASAGIWPSAARYIGIDHNEVSWSHRDGGDGEGFDIDRSARNVTLEYNYAHDNEGGSVLLTGARDSVIRFNILENNSMGALTFYGKAPSVNTSFYNNTVYVSRSANAKIVRTFGRIAGSRVSFKNNIIYSYGPGTYQWPTRSVTTAANTLIGNHGSGRPGDPRTSYLNPRLKAEGRGGSGFSSLGGYKPRHPSSFQRGVAISKSVKTDFFGKRINAARPPRGAAG